MASRSMQGGRVPLGKGCEDTGSRGLSGGVQGGKGALSGTFWG